MTVIEINGALSALRTHNFLVVSLNNYCSITGRIKIRQTGNPHGLIRPHIWLSLLPLGDKKQKEGVGGGSWVGRRGEWGFDVHNNRKTISGANSEVPES